MKSKQFKIFLVSLICLLVLSGCASEDNTNTPNRSTATPVGQITTAQQEVGTPNPVSAVTGQTPATTATNTSLSATQTSWQQVKSFAYQLQNIDLHELAKSDYDLLILDYSRDGSEAGRFNASEINTLKNRAGKPRLVLAYLSIGEAEDYRWYWDNAWDPTHSGTPANTAPAWLGSSNPEWPGNYKVKYWEPGWQALLFGSPNSYLDKIMQAGFDGVYLDIIDAYEYWGPGGESGLNRRSAEQEMVSLVEAMAQYGRRNKPEFGIFPQNGEMLGKYPDYVQTVTGIGREDTWYNDNKANSSNETKGTLADLDLFKQAGKLVLVTDYVTTPSLIDSFYAKAEAKGYIAYATTRELDRLTVNVGHTP